MKIILVPLIMSALAACSPDNRQKTDSWRINKLNILKENGQFIDGKLVNEKEVLHLDYELQFKTEEPFELLVDSQCLNLTTQKRFKTSRVYSAINKVKIISLLPEKNFYDWSQQKFELDCELDFRATNKIGSSHSFRLDKIRITGELKEEISLTSSPLFEPLSGIDLKDIGKNLFTNISSQTVSYEMHCENFITEFKGSLSPKMGMDFFDFKNLKPKGGVEQDHLLRLPQQNCQIIGKDNFGYLSEASAHFNLHAEPPHFQGRLHWTQSYVPDNSSSLDPNVRGDIHLGSIIIENPYSFTSEFEIKKDLSPFFSSQMLTHLHFKHTSRPLYVRHIQAARVIDKGDKFSFNIEANEKAVIQLYSDFRIYCNSVKPWFSAPLENLRLIGHGVQSKRIGFFLTATEAQALSPIKEFSIPPTEGFVFSQNQKRRSLHFFPDGKIKPWQELSESNCGSR